MGKPMGFLEYKRKTADSEATITRVTHYREFHIHMDEEELKLQGARCMDCGIPYCHALGCPVQNLIPEWNDAVYNGRWREAWDRLELTNNLPEITGRICPAPCESSCTLSINSSPVAIKQNELAIVERAFLEGWVIPRPPIHESGFSVAVVGSGPAGLAAAQQLRRSGHRVTVFEKADKPGGLLRYGIPDFKLEKQIIDRRLEQMKVEGVDFETNINVGEDISANFLKKKYDAVLLSMGAGEPRDLIVNGRDLSGVHFALEYLKGSNEFVSGQYDKPPIDAKDKVVLIIGGGDTGSDCVGTAKRQGAKEIYQYEIMPKPMEWLLENNPQWPDWPSILRTSSSHEEGCFRDWSISTEKLTGEKGILTEAHFSRVEWLSPVPGGRLVPQVIPDSGFSKKVDLIFLAMGFVHVQHTDFLSDFGLEFDERGNIKTEFGTYETNVKGIFTAGDANTGASLVVRAIYHGRKAADAIDQFLGEK